jgi:hypothetical protein
MIPNFDKIRKWVMSKKVTPTVAECAAYFDCPVIDIEWIVGACCWPTFYITHGRFVIDYYFQTRGDKDALATVSSNNIHGFPHRK